MRVRVPALVLCALVLSGLAPASAGAAAAAGRLSGLVEDEEGVALHSAKLRLTDSSGTTTTTADEHGGYSVVLPQGIYDLAVTANGDEGPLQAAVLDVEVGANSKVNLVLAGRHAHKAATFTGTLRDTAGTPIPGGSIFLSGGGRTVTDEAGAFVLAVGGGVYDLGVWLSLGGSAVQIRLEDFILTQDRHVDLTVPLISIDVTVRNEAGVPLPGAAVRLDENCGGCAPPFKLFPGGSATRYFDARGYTGPDGRASLVGVPSPTFSLSVSTPNSPWYEPAERTGLSVTSSKSFEVVLPTKAAGFTAQSAEPNLRGRIQTSDSRPVRPRWGVLLPESGPAHPLTFGEDGAYEVSAPAGRYEIALDTLDDSQPRHEDEVLWSVHSEPFDLSGDRTLDLTVPESSLSVGQGRVEGVDSQGRRLWSGEFSTSIAEGTSIADFELAPGIRARSRIFIDAPSGFHPLLASVFSPSRFETSFGAPGYPGVELPALYVGPGELTVVAFVSGSEIPNRRTPGAPGNVRGDVEGETTATVSWSPSEVDPRWPVLGYVVSGVSDRPIYVRAPATTAALTGLAPGTRYRFLVEALNVWGIGERGMASAEFITSGVPVTPPAAPAPAKPKIPDHTIAADPAARSGYWMVSTDGKVYPFGDARHLGEPELGGAEAVDLEPSGTGNGYWVLDDRGGVHAYGDALDLGDAALVAGEKATSLSATGKGYWVFTSTGRVLAFGDAKHFGDMAGTRLNGPVLDSVATPSGKGYYMVASDGGVFTFGDAVFSGSMGDKRLNAPVQSLVPDGDGDGYWLVASDGGIFAFEAPFRGSMGSTRLNRPVTGMVRFGNGYLMVGEDGGIFNFSDREFHGSLGDRPPTKPVVGVAALS
jgi:hypothetical protein